MGCGLFHAANPALPVEYDPMSDPLHVYVDVDDTLIRKGAEEPLPAVVEHVRQLCRQDAVLYCWSTGGASHARRIAARLGIEKCFHSFLHKPQVFIDDEQAAEWPHFVHICPDRLGTLDDYRHAVEQKEEGDSGACEGTPDQ